MPVGSTVSRETVLTPVDLRQSEKLRALARFPPAARSAAPIHLPRRDPRRGGSQSAPGLPLVRERAVAGGAAMNDNSRPSPPLCVIRREAAEHFAAVDLAVRDFRVSRAGFRSVDQVLSQRLADAARSLQSALSAALRPTCIAEPPTAPDCSADKRPPVTSGRIGATGARRMADGASAGRSRRTAARRVTSPASPRRPQLRLYAPTSPV